MNGWYYNPNKFRFEEYINDEIWSWITVELVYYKYFPDKWYEYFKLIVKQGRTLLPRSVY